MSVRIRPELSKSKKLRLFAVSLTVSRTFVGGFFNVYPLLVGLTVVEVGYLKTFQTLIILFFDVPLNYYADRKGHNKTLSLSALFAAITFLMYGFSKNLYMFFLVELFNALSICFFSGSFLAILHTFAEIKNLQFKRENSLFNQHSHLGMLISSLCGGALIYLLSKMFGVDKILSYRIVYFISSFLLGVVYIFSFSFLHSGVALKRVSSSTGKVTYKDDIRIFVQFIKRMKISHIVDTIMLVVNGVIFVIFVQIWQPITYTRSPHTTTALVLSIYFIAVMLSQTLSGKISSRIPHGNQTHVIVMILLAVLLSIIENLKNMSGIFLIITSVCIISLVFYVIRTNFINLESLFLQICPPELKSSLLSMVGLITTTLTIVFLPISFYIVDKIKLGFLPFTFLFFFLIVAYALAKKIINDYNSDT